MRKSGKAIAGMLLILAVSLSWAFAQTQPIPTVTPINQAPGSLMRSKLLNSQNVLEGLLRSDFAAIKKGAQQMRAISEADEWPRSRDQVYEHFSQTFRRQCNQLEQAAEQRQREGVRFTYLAITTTCVNCHDYVRDSRRVAQPAKSGVRLIPSHWPSRVSKQEP